VQPEVTRLFPGRQDLRYRHAGRATGIRKVQWLTENFTIETLTSLEPALTELHAFALARIGETMPLPHILDLSYLPALLRDRPAAVVPYLVTRDDFIARLYHGTARP
jgi:hypothetical protein